MNLFGIELNNERWQKYRSKMNTLYLYNAYLDNRKNNVDGPSIRIIAMALGVLESNATYYCLTWLIASAAPIVSDAPLEIDVMIQVIKTTDDLKNKYVPYLLTCTVPYHGGDQSVQAISIVEDSGNNSSCYKPSNYLKVIYNTEQIKDFAVCVKGLNFPLEDLSARFIEWIELMSILGADKIFFYEYAVHHNVKRVLNHYIKKGIIDVTETTLPGNLSKCCQNQTTSR